jgi:hypothetical protein
VPERAGAHDDLDVHGLAGPESRKRGADGKHGVAALDGEEVDGQALLERLADVVDRGMVAPHRREGRVRGREQVVVDLPRAVPEFLRIHERQMTVATALLQRRVVEGPHGIARDARLVPGVVVVLSAQPPVLVERRKEAHLVARRAEFGRLHERLQERLAVERRLHADEELVHSRRSALSENANGYCFDSR